MNAPHPNLWALVGALSGYLVTKLLLWGIRRFLRWRTLRTMTATGRDLDRLALTYGCVRIVESDAELRTRCVRGTEDFGARLRRVTRGGP